MRAAISLSAFMLCFLAACLLVGRAGVSAPGSEPQEIAILQDWRGDYPVFEFHRFPEGQRTSPIGYLGNEKDFFKVWQAFKPGEQLPDIDFSDHLVIFARNVNFYNRTAIAKAILREDVVEILARETMSALPIEDKVAMALAIIPRAGINYIEAGTERIPVSAGGPGTASDPLNATYTIEGQEITLHNGRFEMAIRPDSATKIRTFVLGDVIEGDLDGDGDKDAMLVFVHDPGGSGTFYYVAASENRNGQYRGMNAVRLGDRVAPKSLQIRNGIIIAAYSKRGPYEPMSSAPSVEALLYLAFDEGKLKALKPLGTDEQILEGRVIIGHEVRSFYPCTRKTDYWLSGDSPALGEIMSRYRKALSDARFYRPLFMVLAGKFVEAPRKGYGANYVGAFLATQLVGVRPEEHCSIDSLGRRPHEGSRLPVKYNNGEEITMNQRLSESMRSWKRFWVVCVIVAFIMTAFAGAVQAGQPDEQGGWEFKTALYLWALSLDGDVTVKGRKSDVDVGFGDILDELNFAGMLAFSGRKGHWGFWGDVIYANLGHSTHIGLIPVDPDMDMLMLAGGGSYRLGTWALSDAPDKEVPTVAVDALVGVRYTYLDVKLDFDLLPDLRGDKGWVDPLIGVRSLWALSKRWDLSLAGDVGGFGVGSDFTWHVHGLVGYRFGLFGEDNAQVFGGYRALSQDYDTGSGSDKFEWDVIMHGPILGLSISF